MCIKDYKIEVGGQGPVRAVELLEKVILLLLLSSMNLNFRDF
jgi:hypothetical protein